jgi:hypothetical protein
MAARPSRTALRQTIAASSLLFAARAGALAQSQDSGAHRERNARATVDVDNHTETAQRNQRADHVRGSPAVRHVEAGAEGQASS